MTSCPVCESPVPPHAQACDTCGKVFVTQALPDVPPATLPDLDLGRVDSRALAMAPEVTPDLDLGRIDSRALDVALDVTPDLDLGRSAVVGAVQFERPAGLEATALARREWTPELETPVNCRACGTPQADRSTIFCAHCGRRLPIRQIALGSLIVDGGEAQGEKVRCLACGASVRRGALCSDCGVPLRDVD